MSVFNACGLWVVTGVCAQGAWGDGGTCRVGVWCSVYCYLLPQYYWCGCTGGTALFAVYLYCLGFFGLYFNYIESCMSTACQHITPTVGLVGAALGEPVPTVYVTKLSSFNLRYHFRAITTASRALGWMYTASSESSLYTSKRDLLKPSWSLGNGTVSFQ